MYFAVEARAAYDHILTRMSCSTEVYLANFNWKKSSLYYTRDIMMKRVTSGIKLLFSAMSPLYFLQNLILGRTSTSFTEERNDFIRS